MTASRTPRLAGFLSACRLAAVLSFLLGATELPAQAVDRGEVTGVVIDQFSGATLSGARVWIDGTAQQTLTDEFGRFLIGNVQPGNVTVLASYAGLITGYEQVTVPPGGRATIAFSLTSEVIELTEFMVRSEREGNAAYIQAQRNAPNVTNILALDALGILPNDNAGELLARMPGIAPRLDEEGAITGVSIRGFQPGDNAVAVDGDRMTSSGGLNRDFRMNSISGALFEEIEVTKAPTPDMDAESLGGMVNFRSRSPLTMKEDHRFDYRVSVKWATNLVDRTPMSQAHPLHPLINLGYQGVYNVFGGHRNLGISLRAFYSENANSAYTVQNYYAYATSTSALPDRGIVNRPFYFQNTYPYEIRFRDLYNNRFQNSLNMRVEFKPTENTRFWMTAVANDARETGQHIYQQRFFFSSQTETYNPDGTIANYGTRLDGTPFSPDYVSLRAGARVQINSTINSFNQYDRRLQLVGEHRIGHIKLTGGVNYSRTKVVMNDTPETGTGVVYTELKSAGSTNINTGHAYIYDGRQSHILPTIIQTRGTPFEDIDSYGGSAGSTTGNLDSRLHYRSRQNRRDTTLKSAYGDASYVPNTRLPMVWKVGFNVREQEVDTPFNAQDYFLVHNNVSAYQEPGVVTFWPLRGGIQTPFLSVPLVTQDIRNNPNNWSQDLDYIYSQNYGNTKNVVERVTAAYAQSTFIFDRIQVLAGLRVEHTETDGFGYLMDPSSPDLSYSQDIAALEKKYNNPTRQENSYTNFFPGVHFKYEPRDSLIFRLSYSTSIGRPNLGDVAPGLSVGNSTDGEYTSYVSMNNPDLEAQYSHNIDLSAEYYFKPFGVISAGIFRKEIRDFIYTEDGGDAGTVLGPDFDGVRLRRKLNGGHARVDGFEFGYQQQLRFLPPLFRGTSVYANFTYLQTEGDYDDGDRTEVARFVPRTANFGIRYRYRAWNLEVNTNYNGKHLDVYQVDPSRRVYRDARSITNVSISYRFSTKFTVFANVNNVFNNSQEFFQVGAEGERFNRNVYNAMSMVFGVNGRF